jgi:hypothetical protein
MRSAIALITALTLAPLAAGARDGIVGFTCESAGRAQKLSFTVDADNGVVAADVPVNWVSLSAAVVWFLHVASANGRQYVTQEYTFDRGAGTLRACDYASADETRDACDPIYLCRANSLTSGQPF